MDNPVAKWLNLRETEILEQLALQAALLSIEELKKQSAGHVEAAKKAKIENAFVNLKLAEAIHGVICQVIDQWSAIDATAQYWLKGAIAYFIADDDEVSDFVSPIGLEDDVEVLNACLRFAGLEQYSLNPEDFDDV